MSVALRSLAVLVALIAAGCSPPTETRPTSAPRESVVTAEPKPAKEPIPPAQTPSLQPIPEMTPVEAAPSTTPVLIYECATPTLPVYDDILGAGYLLDPRAMVSFSGTAATVTVTIDGFTAQEVALTQDVAVPDLLQPVDLTRAFFDTRSDEDRYNGVSGTTRHHAVAVLTDDAGQSVTSECTFDVSFP